MTAKEQRMAGARTLVLGAVAYDPKVVTIWEGFTAWFVQRGLAFDYVLYSNYERLVDALLAGQVDVAWNSPLAWVRARRLAAARGLGVRAVAMRDADCDLRSLVLVLAGGPVAEVADLRGRVVAVGALDSPQATLLPLAHLREAGLEPDRDFEVRRYDVLAGKHGDHVGGERDAAKALAAGEVDAACLLEGNHRLFLSEGLLAADRTRVLTATGRFDHCNFTVIDAAPATLVERFRQLLLAMSPDDPEVRPLLELEGLRAWLPGRTDGYRALEAAVDHTGFYDAAGGLTTAGLRP
jgi:ABC-type phosphate/phosphonate transport system substrate-binding protein